MTTKTGGKPGEKPVRLVSSKEAAEMLGIGSRTVTEWELPERGRIGPRPLWDMRDIIKMHVDRETRQYEPTYPR